MIAKFKIFEKCCFRSWFPGVNSIDSKTGYDGVLTYGK